MLEQLEVQLSDKLHILDKCVSAHEFKRREEAKRRAAEDAEEEERVAFQLIDWHDFVVVETIDFNEEDDEDGQPPGQDVGAQNGEQIAKGVATAEEDDDDGLGDLDVDIDEAKGVEEEEEEDDDDVDMAPPAPPLPPARPTMGGAVAVVEEDEEDGTIVEGYKKADHRRGVGTTKVVDPHTGQLVDADMMSEHMRIKTLDPKWKEQQEREKEKLATTNLAPDGDMSQVLSKFAARRSDIFGDVEAGIGETIDEAGQKRLNPLVAARKAAEVAQPPTPVLPSPAEPPSGLPPKPGGIHLPPAMAARGFPGGPPLNFPGGGIRIGMPPGMPGMGNPQGMPGMMPPMPLAPAGMPPMGGMPLGMPPPRGMAAPPLPREVPNAPGLGAPPTPQAQQPFIPPPAQQPPAPPQAPQPPPPPTQTPAPPPPPQFEEPPAKRLRTEEPGRVVLPPMTFTINLPTVDGGEYDLRGQSINVQVAAGATVKEVKEGIQEAIGVPPGKCQLKDAGSGAFLKDTQPLVSGVRMELAMRERGGRKKN